MSSAGRNPRAALLSEAWSLLDGGHDREAADLFGRLLLDDADCAEARRGLAQARAAAAERARGLEAVFEEAHAAVQANDRERARALLERVVREGGDRDRALAALDKLDPRAGRVEPDLLHAPSSRAASSSGGGGAAAWARRALATGCVAFFALLAAGVDARWDGLIRVLERAPRPQSQATPAPPRIAPLSRGEQALADARRLMEQGDTAGALRALDAVPPEEPAYPFARQLRTQAAATLRAGRSD